MSRSQILAAVVAAFLVTQVAIFTTTVYLHRALVVGFWRVQLGNVGLYKRAARDDEMVRYVMPAGAINAVDHQYGQRPYRNSATNLRPLALVTGGEGLHNNHHAAPTSARFSLHRGELDPGWWAVRALTALRLAHVRHDDVHMKPVA